LPSLCSAQSKEAPKLYKWVDDQGVVHYGDTIPPEFANRDRSVLNNRGVRVGFEEGEITDEERAVIARKEADAEAARAAKLEEARRDRSLLETYNSVSDIEELRDRRLELLESQIKVTETYLANLRKRLVTLQEEASNYKPYTTRENAPQVPDNLALDISRTADSINGYERTLAQTRADQEALRNAFDKDIRRFKELKGG
jgi:chromosome segregation ATPase